jgi:hypothetical protein
MGSGFEKYAQSGQIERTPKFSHPTGELVWDSPLRVEQMRREDGQRNAALNAARGAEQPISPPLTANEQKQAGEMAEHTKTLHNSIDMLVKKPINVDLTDEEKKGVDQARLDVEQDFGCMTNDQLKRFLPAINKQLEPGFRVAEVPQLNAITLGRLDPSTGQYESFASVDRSECHYGF